MAVATTCPNCKALFRLDDEMAGKKVKCQRCAHIFIVPNAGDNTVAPAASVSQPAADMQVEPAPPADVPMPPKVPEEMPEGAVTADDALARPSGKKGPPPSLDKSDDRPSKRERRTPSDSGSNATLMAMLVLFGLGGLVVCAGFCGVLGWLFYAIHDEGKPEEPVVKKADLIAKGNANKGKMQPPPPLPPPPLPPPPPQPGLKDAAINVVLGPDGSFTSNNVLTQKDPVYLGQRTKHYAIQMEAGQTYQIDLVTGTKGYDPYLYLYDNKNNLLTQDDDGGGFPNARIVFRAPQNGAYHIHATHFGGFAGSANFTLTVRKL